MEPTRNEWKDWAAAMNKESAKERKISFYEICNIMCGMSSEQARAAKESAEIQSAMCRKYGNDNL